MEFEDEVNKAYVIIRAANIGALAQCKEEGINVYGAYQALMQECMRKYADAIDSDEEAIRQIRKFLDDWYDEVVSIRH